MGTNGMVACTQPLAAEAGLAILKKGGNAAEAAVTVGACLAVLEPCSTGLGGDGFYLQYDGQSKQVTAVNGSGRAPQSLTLDVAKSVSEGKNALPTFHPHTITVPGVVHMWIEALERNPSKNVTRAEVFERAIQLCEEGFPVSQVAAGFWEHYSPQIKEQRHGAELLTPAGKAPAAGEIFKRPTLAKTLRAISDHGKDGFYKGWVAEAITKEIQDAGGLLSTEDLAAHTTTYDSSISTDFGGVTVHGHPPNGQGITALIALNIVKEIEKNGKVDLSEGKRHSPETLHCLIEALRLAFADAHQFVCDPAHHDIPIAALLSSDYAKTRASLFNPSKAAADVTAGQPLKDSCTVSFQVTDSSGNAISMVNSTYMGFGTCMVPEGTGMTLQNRGYNFSLDASSPNCLQPGKRPYHTIIPCITTHTESGELHTTFTNMGGFMQPQGHVQHLVNLLYCGMDPQESIDEPRFCILNDAYSGVFGRVAIEPGFDNEDALLASLRALGHDTYVMNGPERATMGRAQIIAKLDNGVMLAGSDARADGCAMGW